MTVYNNRAFRSVYGPAEPPKPERETGVWECARCGYGAYFFLMEDGSIQCTYCKETIDYKWFDPMEGA